MKHIRDPNRPVGDTPSPADSPLGSRRSRASARAKMEARGLPQSCVLIFCGHEKNLCHCPKCEEFMRLVHLDARKPRAIPISIFVGVDAQGHCVDFEQRAPSCSPAH